MQKRPELRISFDTFGRERLDRAVEAVILFCSACKKRPHRVLVRRSSFREIEEST